MFYICKIVVEDVVEREHVVALVACCPERLKGVSFSAYMINKLNATNVTTFLYSPLELRKGPVWDVDSKEL